MRLLSKSSSRVSLFKRRFLRTQGAKGPALGVTPGEPAGIGPDICLQSWQHLSASRLTCFADLDLLKARAKLLGIKAKFNNLTEQPWQAGKMNVQPVPLRASVQPGVCDPANAGYVVDCLEAAVTAFEKNEMLGLVTGPVQKSVIREAGIPFSGHTEWLAKRTATQQVVMMLASGKLRVALVTRHLPLMDVSAAITKEHLKGSLQVLHQELISKFNLANPRILVCGLNPHAGEAGYLGREEIETITPALDELRQAGLSLKGPVAADTAFTPEQLEGVDAVVAMYHDQGLPVLKHASFGEAVNITLGLPLIRTSVDHGTALELAGTGRANNSSLLAAIRCAESLAESIEEAIEEAIEDPPCTSQTSDSQSRNAG